MEKMRLLRTGILVEMEMRINGWKLKVIHEVFTDLKNSNDCICFCVCVIVCVRQCQCREGLIISLQITTSL